MYPLVGFYSVRFQDREVSEFKDFLNRMEDRPTIEVELLDLLELIRVMGEEEGALPEFFRPEQHGSELMAIPPKRMPWRQRELSVGQLRLYCLHLSEGVVILFNGEEKTKGPIKAQDCPVVGPYFKQANRLARVLGKARSSGDIDVTPSRTRLKYESELTLRI